MHTILYLRYFMYNHYVWYIICIWYASWLQYSMMFSFQASIPGLCTGLETGNRRWEWYHEGMGLQEYHGLIPSSWYIILVYIYDIYIYIYFEGDGKQIPDIKIALHNRMEHNVDGFSPIGSHADTSAQKRLRRWWWRHARFDMGVHKWQHSSRGYCIHTGKLT